MAEHPNYKYRPRRRKHTKARAGGPAAVANQSAANNNSNTPAPSSSATTTRATPPVANSDHFDERISPYHQNNGYYSASNHHQHQNQQQVGNSNSNSMHTPESSPTQSPEPISAGAQSGKSSGKGHPKLDTKLDNLPALPTPEMSPLELSERKMHDSYLEYASKAEKMHGFARSNTGENVLMMDGVAVSSSASGQLSSATYATSNNNNNNHIKREYYGAETDLMAGKSAAISLSKYYESSVNSGRYLNSTSSPLPMVTTATVRGKGSMYVTCSNRGILDQGHTVKGTYFPPLPTSQDHQNLGTTTMSSSMSNTSSGGGALNYSSGIICNQQQLHNSHHQMQNSHLNNNNNPLIKNHNSGGPNTGLMDSSAYYNSYQTPSPVTYYSKEFSYSGGDGPLTNGTNNNEDVQKGLYLVDSNHNYHDYESYNAIVTGAQYSTSPYSMSSHGILTSSSGSPSHMMTTNHQMLPDYYETYISSGQQQQQQQNTVSNLSIGTGSEEVGSGGQVPTTASIKMEHHNSPYQPTHMNHIGLPPIQPHHLTAVSASAQNNPTTTEQQPIMTDDFSNILAGVRKTCYSN